MPETNRRGPPDSPSVPIAGAVGVLAAERVSHSDPGANGSSGSAELLIDGIDPRRRPERSAGTGEEVLADDTEVRVAAIEYIVHPCEDLEAPGDEETTVEIQDRVAGKLTVDVAILLITASVGVRAGQQVGTDGQPGRHLPIRPDFQHMTRIGGNAISRRDLNDTVIIGAGVRWTALRK